MEEVEFKGVRSKLYKESLEEYPEARLEDIEVMKKYLAPQNGEIILEVGAGSGFFSKYISELIGKKGKLIVSDPSSDQLDQVRKMNKVNIEVVNRSAEEIELEQDSIDAVWSFGAIHHCFRKRIAFDNFYRVLKMGGRLVIGDVFEDSKLSKHFDGRVDQLCLTGHHVEFWTDEMAKKLARSVGFKSVEIFDLPIKWRFDSK